MKQRFAFLFLIFLVFCPLLVDTAAALDVSSPDCGFGFQNGNYLYFRDPISINVEQIASSNSTFGNWVFFQKSGSSEVFGFYASGVDVTVNSFFTGNILELNCVGSGYVKVQVCNRAQPTSVSAFTNSYNSTDKIVTLTVLSSGVTQLVWSTGPTISLSAGWNLISFSTLPSDTSFAAIFSSMSFYQVRSGWNGSAYQTPTDAEAGKSYWVFVLADASILISGSEVYSATFSLSAGWNMLGSIDGKTLNAATLFTGHYQLVSWSDGYVTAATIEPGKGYFAFVLAPQTVTLS